MRRSTAPVEPSDFLVHVGSWIDWIVSYLPIIGLVATNLVAVLIGRFLYGHGLSYGLLGYLLLPLLVMPPVALSLFAASHRQPRLRKGSRILLVASLVWLFFIIVLMGLLYIAAAFESL